MQGVKSDRKTVQFQLHNCIYEREEIINTLRVEEHNEISSYARIVGIVEAIKV